MTNETRTVLVLSEGSISPEPNIKMRTPFIPLILGSAGGLEIGRASNLKIDDEGLKLDIEFHEPDLYSQYLDASGLSIEVFEYGFDQIHDSSGMLLKETLKQGVIVEAVMIPWAGHIRMVVPQ